MTDSASPNATPAPAPPPHSASAPIAAAQNSGGLLKVLGLWFGIAAAIGNTIAAGIARTPGFIATQLPNPWLFVGIWVLGGIYALLGASSLAELGSAIPKSGGQYNYSRRAFGDYAGFIVGWSDWLSTCGTSAAVVIVIAEYSAALFPALAGQRKTLSVAILVLFGLLQWRGTKWGSSAQLLTAGLKTVAFVVLVIACFFFGHAHAAEAAQSAPTLPHGWPLLVGIMLALQQVIYTVDGWDAVIYFGEEVKEPGRDVPRAIFLSVLSILGIYLLLNIAVLWVLPMSQIRGNDFALGAAANVVFGRLGDPIIRSIMIVSLLSCINACQMFSTRVLYAMSCDGLFLRQATKVNRGGTPGLALFLSTLVAVVFALGSFDRVIAMLSFFFVANYTLSYASLFWLRKRDPQMPRPYKAWGYPWTSGLALVASAIFLVASLVTDRDNAPLAFYMLIASYPLFLLLKWISAKTAAAATA